MAAPDISIFNARKTVKDIRQGKADSKALERRWDTLARRHKNRWVGVYKKNFIYEDTLPRLIKRARAKGWDVGSMVVAHLEPKRRAVLLRLGDSRLLQ